MMPKQKRSRKSLLVSLGAVVAPGIFFAIGQPSLGFLTLGIDIGAFTMFLYISWSLYKAMKDIGNIQGMIEKMNQAMEGSGIEED